MSAEYECGRENSSIFVKAKGSVLETNGYAQLTNEIKAQADADVGYAGTLAMIKSSKNGRMILLKSRLNISLLISLLICILFAFIEFVTKYIIFDLGNLNAGVESLMIERTMHLPYIISDLSIWQFIVLLYLFYLIISVMISIIGLLVSKISRGNIEAFSIMSVIIVGVSYILNIL